VQFEDHSLRVHPDDLICCCSQAPSVWSRIESVDSRTNTRALLRSAQNDIAAPTTHRSMFFIRSVRCAAARNSDGSTSSLRSSSMRTTRSNIGSPSPTRLAMGWCTSLKRFAMSADLMRVAQAWSAASISGFSAEGSGRRSRLPPAAEALRAALTDECKRRGEAFSVGVEQSRAGTAGEREGTVSRVERRAPTRAAARAPPTRRGRGCCRAPPAARSPGR